MEDEQLCKRCSFYIVAVQLFEHGGQITKTILGKGPKMFNHGMKNDLVL